MNMTATYKHNKYLMTENGYNSFQTSPSWTNNLFPNINLTYNHSDGKNIKNTHS